MTSDKKDLQTEDLKIEYLPDDGGVKVNGEWYANLERYFKHREENLKKES